MTSLWIRIGAVAVLVAAVVLGGVFVLRDSETEQVSVPFDFNDWHLSGRDEFSICVDAVGDAQPRPGQIEAVREAMDIALEKALQIAPERLDRLPVEYSEPVLVEGCPKPRLLSGSLASERPFDRRFRLDSDIFVGPGGGTMSAHRTFVYFLDAATYTDAFGAEPYADSNAEVGSNGGDVIRAVTQAVYLPEDADALSIQGGLLATLNLLSREEIQMLVLTGVIPQEVPTAPPPELGYETWENYYQGVALPISEGRTPTTPGPAPAGLQPDPSHGGSARTIIVTPTPARTN